MSKRPRPAFWAIATALVAATATLLVVASTPRSPLRASAQLGIEKGRPRALAQHIKRLMEASPVAALAEGPGSAEEYRFQMRAYPDTDISIEKIESERAAYSAMAKRGFPTGRGRPGTWVTVGPSNALYPATIFRSSYSYVPAAYVAGGRTTALAISPLCTNGNCTLWVGPAGGGIWRTRNALDGQPNWQFLSGPFGMNSIGSIALDPNDPTGNTIWVGTGEANACGSGCAAGVGLYRSTDGGDTWAGPYGTGAFNARGVGSIAVAPGDANTIYAASVRAGRGISSVGTGGVVTLVPGAPQWGLYKSSDGGATWTFIHNGAAAAAECLAIPLTTQAANTTNCSPRGVRQVVIDPADASVVYASSFARGVWRSNDGGATWTQIKPSLSASQTTTRPMMALNLLPSGDTRMYVAEGASGSPYSRLFRSDSVRTGSPAFQDLTSSDPANAGYGSFNYCTGQCWYDNFVVSPAGYPDIVYLGGSYSYGETGGISNGRGVVLSTDAGVSFTDLTMDATDPYHPNGLHPDQHDLVVNPNNPLQFFEGNDGGIMRSSGAYADVGAWCDARGLAEPELSRCRQLLSRVPTELQSMNKGLTTLQFWSLSVSPFNSNLLQGGTQDNGTWQSTGNPVKWINTMIGDGGQSGFDVANRDFRFHTFYDASPDVNFSGGDMADWNWIGDLIFGHANTQFYVPIISDPKVSGTMFVGTGRTVYRTKTWGMGTMSLAEFRQHCNEWFGDFAVVCGDWVGLGPVRLTSAAFGDRSGGAVAAVERTPSDTGTAWAATTTGRVFISKNVDAEPASAVAWTRLDSLATNDPNRFVSGIYVDPANPNRAWVSYSGFDASTPATPGHVFIVTYDPGTGSATWSDLDPLVSLGDQPITDIVCDYPTGDLYAASDVGVYRKAAGSTTWTFAAPGMPKVEVASLTVVPGARKLYAATHGLGAWLLNLP